MPSQQPFATSYWLVTIQLIVLLCPMALPLTVRADAALDSLSRAAAEGSIEAMRSLARIYAQKDNAHFSPAQARAWYDKAAQRGDGRSQRALGALYELGIGGPVDYGRAAYWYQKAALQGIARAQTNLGNLYQTGRGVPQDFAQAYRWYKAAARQGYPRAQVYLGLLYQQGKGTDTAHDKALYWFKKAAIQGYTRGQLQLGRAYEHGLGVDRDPAKALYWYRQAAAQNYPPAVAAVQRLRAAGNSTAHHAPATPTAAGQPATARQEGILIQEKEVHFANSLADRLLRDLDNLAPQAEEKSEAFLADLMQRQCSDYNLDFLDGEVLAAEADLEEEDPGLTFEAGYRFRDGDTDSQRQSAYAGLSWDLFNEGLLENRSQARRKAMEEHIHEIRAARSRLHELFSCRDTLLIHQFNRFKRNILQQREQVLAQQYRLSRKAYFSGEILLDDLLKVEAQLARTKARLTSYNRLLGQIVDDSQLLLGDGTIPGVLALNLGPLTDAIRHDAAVQQLSSLSREILEEQYDPLYEKRLRLYARTGVSEDRGVVSSGDLTAGIYFSTPLLRQSSKPLPPKVNRMRARLRQQQETRLREVSRLYNSYNEKLTDATTMYYRLQQVGERLRRSRLRSDIRFHDTGRYGFAEHRLVLDHLQELLNVRLEYIAVLESLYRRLLHTVTLLETGFRNDFTSPVALNIPLHRGRAGERAVYIWSKSFAGNDNAFLFHLLRAQGINRVILSVGRKTDQGDKFSRFLEQAAVEHITVELMISNTRWLFAENRPKATLRVQQLAALGHPLHLDIEPHTLDQYKDKRTQFDDLLYDLVEKIRTICSRSGVGLSLSLPTTVAPDLLVRLATLSDTIYIMAYGATSLSRLEERLAPFMKLPPAKLAIALRPGDFDSQLAMEERMDALLQRTAISTFAFHDLEQLLTTLGLEAR